MTWLLESSRRTSRRYPDQPKCGKAVILSHRLSTLKVAYSDKSSYRCRFPKVYVGTDFAQLQCRNKEQLNSSSLMTMHLNFSGCFCLYLSCLRGVIKGHVGRLYILITVPTTLGTFAHVSCCQGVSLSKRKNHLQELSTIKHAKMIHTLVLSRKIRGSIHRDYTCYV